MKFIVTGASGFIGSEVRKRLEELGHQVIAIDKTFRNPAQDQFEIDITSEAIEDVISQDSVLIHLAAVSNNKDFDSSPSFALKTNIVGTQNLYEIASKKKIRHFIFASSEWVYPESQHSFPISENVLFDVFSIKSRYGLSKLFSEFMLKEYCTVPTSILRFGIVYGPRPSPASAIESLTWEAFNQRPIEVKSPESSRCFIFIDDLVDGIIAVASNKPKGTCEVLNLCGDSPVSMRKIIETLQLVTNFEGKVLYGNEIPSLRFPLNAKFKENFDWNPKTSLAAGMIRLLDFYKIN